MKKLLYCIIIMLTGAGIAHAQGNDTTYGLPTVVLTITDPWAMVVGADVPSFALYDKGQIIYKKLHQGKPTYYEIKLPYDELLKVCRSFSISTSIRRLPGSIQASTATDQPSNILLLNFADTPKQITVYGDLTHDSAARKKTPKAFLFIYDQISKYQHSQAKAWLPEQVELLFWDFEYAEESNPWPEGLPDLQSPTTIRRGDGPYSVYLTREQFKKYYDFIAGAAASEKTAVTINGKKMSLSYRFPFPNVK